MRRGQPTLITVYDPPADVVSSWGPFETKINQAELHMVPVLVASMAEEMRGRHVLWFIDNSAAETAMVKAGSPTESMSMIALAASAALVKIDTKGWFEHVASKDNPADVLSREALEDADVKARLISGEWLWREPSTSMHASFCALPR